jgi:hypothetical protein
VETCKLIPTADQIAGLLEYFASHCRDLKTLNQLRSVVRAPTKWKTCYSLFQRIRVKTLRADKRNDVFLQHQYTFEEICAKTLYNMSMRPADYSTAYPAPFDDDSPEYVVSIADGFADYLKIPRVDLNQLQSFRDRSLESAITSPCPEARLAGFSKWMRGWFGLGDG